MTQMLFYGTASVFFVFEDVIRLPSHVNNAAASCLDVMWGRLYGGNMNPLSLLAPVCSQHFQRSCMYELLFSWSLDEHSGDDVMCKLINSLQGSIIPAYKSLSFVHMVFVMNDSQLRYSITGWARHWATRLWEAQENIVRRKLISLESIIILASYLCNICCCPCPADVLSYKIYTHIHICTYKIYS